MVNVKEIEGKNFNIKRSAEEDRILSFKDHVCIGCGLCEATCPVEAIALSVVMKRLLKIMLFSKTTMKSKQNYALMKTNVFSVVCVVEYVQQAH